MPVNIADLTADYRFHARMLHDGDLPAQKKWLVQQYMTEAEDRSGAEVTNTAFRGSSHAAQFRASNPEDRRIALVRAIEEIEAEIDGDYAKSLSRPFGVSFSAGREPHQLFGR